MKGTVGGGFFLTTKGSDMDRVKKLAKNKWVWIIALAAAALAGGGSYGDQITEVILSILGS